ncbi:MULTISPECIES: acyl-CoA dehydrogenase family protein [unclassified Streptomyces]|uniref:acyl-CoA dehydrogenase family protein n=1 Tax=unclassified Streptomyces TaxID=2593676 RepID=UPI001660D526|nr:MULTISPECIES: acyl-CoA dehydrogenase family protein [unclassified Streptomyces]MBD0709328.1 acyl-CoA dehydrogenase [Streptomyces sp. CBMA291]MBD0712541.1 acyl-CoA dehydrogenase [Streptomyces sp. CBMA370]
MDFTPSEEQRAVRELGARIFADLATHERLRAAGTGTDPELWKALCAAGLPAAVEETGLLGLVLLLEEQGRVTAQVPLAATCAYGILAVARLGTGEQRARLLPGLRDGTTVVTGAFPAPGTVTARVDRSDGGPDGGPGGGPDGGPGGGACGRPDGLLDGTVPWVPWLLDATHVLVPDRENALWLVRTEDAARTEPVALTAPWSAGRLVLDGTPGERLGDGDAHADVLAVARTAFAGLQAGVCAGALARAVAHTSVREQFGRPLATRQAVQLRAADSYMDTEAIRVTAYEAAWRFDRGLGAGGAALTAAWWASEAGKRVVHTGQHLHGGMGADLDHPVHRHFLWGRQLDAYLGSGAELLAELGDLLAEGEPS